MKKIIVSLILCFLAVGCEEQLAKPDLRDMLMNLQPQEQAKWNARFGDSLDSKQTSNIALAIQVINNQGEAIKQLDERLAVVEDPNNSLENRIKPRCLK